MFVAVTMSRSNRFFNLLLSSSESPLTAAAVGDNRSEMIIALVNGGAHLDFRARDSQTALHKAAITGKVFSVKVSANQGLPWNSKMQMPQAGTVRGEGLNK